ncbi:phosphate transport system protein [Gammaproteobacteria bacterium]
MFTKDHTAKKYDQDLDSIRSRVLLMGGLVESQIRAAIEAFAEGDTDKAAGVDREDHRVNALEVAIDQDCAQIIARRQPAAVDLRMLMGISKIVTDLERSGDEASKIARMTRTIYGRDMCRVSCITDVRDMGNLAVGMLRAALDTFVRQDAVEAANIVREDLEIDTKFWRFTRQLITFMMEDPQRSPAPWRSCSSPRQWNALAIRQEPCGTGDLYRARHRCPPCSHRPTGTGSQRYG